MIFTHDTEVALQGVAALVNSAGTDGDSLTTVPELDAFVRRWRFSGTRSRDRAELARVQALRPRLRELWSLDEEAVAQRVNSLLAEARAVPRLVNHDEWGWHLHATEDDAPFPVRLAVEAAMAFVDLVRMGELARLQVCGAPGCGDVYVDLSRNRSRRFCGTTCGNRVAAAAYRERQAQQEE